MKYDWKNDSNENEVEKAAWVHCVRVCACILLSVAKWISWELVIDVAVANIWMLAYTHGL